MNLFIKSVSLGMVLLLASLKNKAAAQQSGSGDGEISYQCMEEPSVCSEYGTWCNQLNATIYKCQCEPGLTDVNGLCVPALQFGGRISFLIPANRAILPTEAQVRQFLENTYKNTQGYQSVGDIKIDDGGADYIILYNVTSDITTAEISLAMATSLDTCGITCPIDIGKIDQNTTIEQAGNYSPAICNDYIGYCDETSTTCSSQEGVLVCNCNTNYVPMGGNKQLCTFESCNADSECNGPFGKCVVTPGSPSYCQCIWGFSGTYCKSPWLFVFVIVGGSLLLIAVALVIFLCVSSSKKGKKVKSKVSKHAENGTLHENPFYDSKGNMPESTENILNTFNYKFNGNMRATVPSNLNTDDDNYKRRSHAPSERAGSNASDNRSYVPDLQYEEHGRSQNRS